MIEELSFLLKANPFVAFTIRTSDESFEIQRSTVAKLSQNSLFLDVGTQTLILPFSAIHLISVHGRIRDLPRTSGGFVTGEKPSSTQRLGLP
jgi:hypothetical protein